MLTAFLLCSRPSLAGPDPRTPGPSEEIQSSIASADDAIKKVYISDKYTTKNPKFKSGVALTDIELDAIEAFIDGPGDPKKKSLYMVRYGNDYMRSAELLAKAKKKGFKVAVFVTDANQFMTGNFAKDEKFVTDLEKKAVFKSDNPMAAVAQEMLAKGAKFNDPSYGIFSQPVYDKGDDTMIPIMHEKTTLLRDENLAKNQFQLFISTGNWTDNPRYNRLYEIADQDLAEYYLTHIEDMMQTFAKGGEIKDTPDRVPRKVIYKDGSHIEMAFTEGKYNPNDRITKKFTDALDPANKIKVKNITFSEFVLTKKDQVDALEELMIKDKALTVQGVFDAKFVDLDGFGMAARLKGYDVYRRFGGSVEGLQNTQLTNRANIYMYQSPAIDPKTGKIRLETTTDGPPTARKVWHDKTMVIEADIDEKPSNLIYTGTLNNSNHYENAEVQLEIVSDAKSLLAEGTTESIMKVAKAETQFAIPMDIGITRQSIAGITGHSELEVPVPRAEAVNKAILARDFDTVITELQAQTKLDSTLRGRPNATLVRERIKRAKNFFAWYKTNIPPSNEPSTDLRLRKLNSIALMLSQDKPKWDYIEESIRSVIDRPKLKPDDLEKFTRAGWKAFGMRGIPPSQKVLPIIAFAFDWDDNLVNMPTKIRVFEKNSTVVKEVTTAEYAKIRNEIGKTPPWEKFELRDGANGSFSRFTSKPGDNFFLDDLVTAMKSPADIWQGPSWKAFVEALDSPETAKYVSIITARQHDPKDILAALESLKQRGIIKNVPLVQNLHAVGASANPSLEKVKAMRAQLEEINKIPLSQDSHWAIDPDGTAKRQIQLWGFSDDDFGNFDAAVKELGADVKAGKYPNVKISLFYTGNTQKNKGPIGVVIKSDGSTRPISAEELKEVPSMMPIKRIPCSRMYNYLVELLRRTLAPILSVKSPRNALSVA